MRPSKWVFVSLAVLLAAVIFLLWHSGPFRHAIRSAVPVPSAPLPAAFLHARWGMSPAQVEKANGSPLGPYQSFRRLYRLNGGIKDQSRYKTLQAELPDFLGKPAVIAYVFFDDRLFLYSITSEGSDAEEIESRVKPYLIKQFGDRFASPHDAPPLKAIWMGKDVVVNYWEFLDDRRLRPKYLAVFSVEYRPLSTAIDRLTS